MGQRSDSCEFPELTNPIVVVPFLCLLLVVVMMAFCVLVFVVSFAGQCSLTSTVL